MLKRWRDPRYSFAQGKGVKTGLTPMFVALLALTGLVVAGSPEPSLSAAATDPIATTCSLTDKFSFVDVGVVVDATKLGVEVGTAIANSTAYVTPGGTVRMYFGAEGNVKSAVSSDGITFSVEAGNRIQGSGHFKVLRLDDGRLRLFIAKGVEDIFSYISSDGLTWTQESGIRISRTDAGMPDGMMGLTIVPTSGGGFRGYTSDLARTDRPPGGHFIKSATSTDLLTWTVESGVRIGNGAPTVTDTAEQPHALLRGSNCVTLFYFNALPSHAPGSVGTYYSTSTDGVTFTNAYSLGINGNGPNIVRLNDGTYLLYYDAGNETQGFSIRVGKLELTPSVSIATNQSTYQAGDRMVVTVTTAPGSSSDRWYMVVVLLTPLNTTAEEPFFIYRFDPVVELITVQTALSRLSTSSFGEIAARPVSAITGQSLTILDVSLPALPAGDYAWAAILFSEDFGKTSNVVGSTFRFQ